MFGIVILSVSSILFVIFRNLIVDMNSYFQGNSDYLKYYFIIFCMCNSLL